MDILKGKVALTATPTHNTKQPAHYSKPSLQVTIPRCVSCGILVTPRDELCKSCLGWNLIFQSTKAMALLRKRGVI